MFIVKIIGLLLGIGVFKLVLLPWFDNTFGTDAANDDDFLGGNADD